MTKNIKTDAEGVKSPRRDKLTRLGNKLDAAEAANDDAWVTYYFEYEPKAIKHALSTNIPKVKITTIAEFWRVHYLWLAACDREKAIQADIGANSEKGSRRMRTAADLKAQLAVARRDRNIYATASNEYQDAKKAKKRKAITIAKHRRDAVRGIAKAIHSAIGRAAP